MRRHSTCVLSAAFILGAVSLAQGEASCEISMGPVQRAQKEALDAAARGLRPDDRPRVRSRQISSHASRAAASMR
jgi:hypothetical protein